MKAQPFIIYDTATGAIVLRLLADPAIQNPGEGMAVLVLDSAAWDVVGDASPEGEAALIAGVRAALWAKVKAQRAALKNAGFEVSNIGAFQSDPESRENIIGGVLGALRAQAMKGPFGKTWTLADNSEAPLDAEAMIEVGLALDALIDGCHTRARDLYAAIHDPEADLAALLTIDVGSGWPGGE